MHLSNRAPALKVTYLGDEYELDELISLGIMVNMSCNMLETYLRVFERWVSRGET